MIVSQGKRQATGSLPAKAPSLFHSGRKDALMILPRKKDAAAKPKAKADNLCYKTRGLMPKYPAMTTAHRSWFWPMISSVFSRHLLEQRFLKRSL